MEPAPRSKRDELGHQYNLADMDARSTASTSFSRRPSAKQAPHHSSKQLQECLNPVRGIRDALRRQGIEPMNHARHNAAAIKAVSEVNRSRKAQLQQEAEEAGRKPRPCSAVSTRSSGYGSPGYMPWRPATTDLDGCSETRSESGRSACTSRSVRAHSLPVFKPFRRAAPLNGAAVEDRGEGWLAKDEYGRVPQYILERRLSMAQAYAEELAAAEASAIPQGMRVLPEEERQEMLTLLARSRAEEEEKLLALPFVIKTEKHQRYKAEVEERLAEIEEAWHMFSQPRVLVEL